MSTSARISIRISGCRTASWTRSGFWLTGDAWAEEGVAPAAEPAEAARVAQRAAKRKVDPRGRAVYRGPQRYESYSCYDSIASLMLVLVLVASVSGCYRVC